MILYSMYMTHMQKTFVFCLYLDAAPQNPHETVQQHPSDQATGQENPKLGESKDSTNRKQGDQGPAKGVKYDTGTGGMYFMTMVELCK